MTNEAGLEFDADHTTIINIINQDRERKGITKSSHARSLGMYPQNYFMVLKGKRELTEEQLGYLGYRLVKYYVKIDGGTNED